MGVIKTILPLQEPVTLEEAKLELRVTHAEDDGRILAFIGAAREEAEHALGRTLITSTYRLSLEQFPRGMLDLPFPILQNVTSIKYFDAAGAQQTLATNDYWVDLAESYVKPVVAWPSTQARPGAVEAIFIAGWTDVAFVPESIKLWILMRVRSLFNSDPELMQYADCLLAPHKIWSI